MDYTINPNIYRLHYYCLFCRRFEIESGAGDWHRQQEDLQQMADGLSLQLAASDQEHEQQRATLRDLSQSLAALQAERTSLEDRVREARDYIAAVSTRRDQRLARTELASARASHLPSLLARLAEDATTSSMCSGEGSAVTEDSLSVISEPRIGTLRSDLNIGLLEYANTVSL
jgi:chromosome segregation ATPase